MQKFYKFYFIILNYNRILKACPVCFLFYLTLKKNQSKVILNLFLTFFFQIMGCVIFSSSPSSMTFDIFFKIEVNSFTPSMNLNPSITYPVHSQIFRALFHYDVNYEICCRKWSAFLSANCRSGMGIVLVTQRHSLSFTVKGDCCY